MLIRSGIDPALFLHRQTSIGELQNQRLIKSVFSLILSDLRLRIRHQFTAQSQIAEVDSCSVDLPKHFAYFLQHRKGIHLGAFRNRQVNRPGRVQCAGRGVERLYVAQSVDMSCEEIGCVRIDDFEITAKLKFGPVVSVQIARVHVDFGERDAEIIDRNCRTRGFEKDVHIGVFQFKTIR